MSFKGYVAFLFDHDIHSECEKYDPWYFRVEIESTPNGPWRVAQALAKLASILVCYLFPCRYKECLVYPLVLLT